MAVKVVDEKTAIQNKEEQQNADDSAGKLKADDKDKVDSEAATKEQSNSEQNKDGQMNTADG